MSIIKFADGVEWESSAFAVTRPPPRPKLGDEVVYRAVFKRIELWNREKLSHLDKTWVVLALVEAKTGIFVGWRTLQEGHTQHMGDDGLCWVQTKALKAAVVYFHERRKPALVPADKLESTK